jgi:hypothetical protein
MKRSLFVGLLFLSFLVAPRPSHAQLMDGGLEIFEFPCTCSPFRYAMFTPLWLGTVVPIAGALAIPDTPNLFPFFILHPGAWMLGFETPAVQACWMYAGAGCFPLPVLGTLTPFTGSSI